MSGGAWDYSQYQITTIAESIESYLNRQGKPKSKDELWNSSDYYEKYPEEKFYPSLRKDVEEEFRKGLNYLKLAAVYAQRIDWLLSGDDGEDSFIERLEYELKKLNDE